MNTALLKAAGLRALRTLLQGIIAAIPVGVGFEAVGWVPLLSVAGLAAVTSFLQGVAAGLPEVSAGEYIAEYEMRYETDIQNAVEGNPSGDDTFGH